jgi:hypothetical protein
MEALTRLVADSLARHGLDRPVDPRRLQWSRWFRCDSPHSLLTVPSKPGIFALAEEILDLGTPSRERSTDREGYDSSTSLCHSERSQIDREADELAQSRNLLFARTATSREGTTAHPPAEPKRMLAVLQFSEDDDMAFTLDRMFTRINPMRERLASGRCFLRFVVLQDQEQRRSICSALNQWMRTSAEKASGIGADFQSSLEFTTDRVGTDRVGRTLLSDSADAVPTPARQAVSGQEGDVAQSAMHLDSGSNKNIHCPHPLPSGF